MSSDPDILGKTDFRIFWLEWILIWLVGLYWSYLFFSLPGAIIGVGAMVLHGLSRSRLRAWFDSRSLTSRGWGGTDRSFSAEEWAIQVSMVWLGGGTRVEVVHLDRGFSVGIPAFGRVEGMFTVKGKTRLRRVLEAAVDAGFEIRGKNVFPLSVRLEDRLWEDQSSLGANAGEGPVATFRKWLNDNS